MALYTRQGNSSIIKCGGAVSVLFPRWWNVKST